MVNHHINEPWSEEEKQKNILSYHRAINPDIYFYEITDFDYIHSTHAILYLFFSL